MVYGLTWTSWNQLTVIQSGSAIKAYLNGDPAGGLSVTDADHPYLGGYLGLMTYDGTGDFRNLAVGDNMPTWGTQDDWVSRAGDGDWAFVGDSFIKNDSIYGQINLRTITTAGITRDVQLGDGTYTASINTLFSDNDEWGGLALTNDGITRSWSTGGYVVFLRGNGNLGIYKAGVGQVVADVATGSIPWRRAYRVRVVKTGPNFQVFFEDQPDPLINWTDTNASAWASAASGLPTSTRSSSPPRSATPATTLTEAASRGAPALPTRARGCSSGPSSTARSLNPREERAHHAKSCPDRGGCAGGRDAGRRTCWSAGVGAA